MEQDAETEVCWDHDGTFLEAIKAKKEIILSELKKETKTSQGTAKTKRTVVQEEKKKPLNQRLKKQSTSGEVVQPGKALNKTLEEIEQSEPISRDTGVGLFHI